MVTAEAAKERQEAERRAPRASGGKPNLQALDIDSAYYKRRGGAYSTRPLEDGAR